MSTVFAIAPALPLGSAGKYVAAAYIAFLVLVLIYVAIMASRLARTERDLAELQRDVELRQSVDDPDHADRSDRSDREREHAV